MALTANRTPALMTLVFPVLVACVSKPYVLPTADGGPRPSPPSLQGRIVRVEPEQIVVSADHPSTMVGSETVVRLTLKTEIFTAYGGHVPPSTLVPGIRVRVWCARPAKPKRGEVLTAAMVMIASKDPNDDWP